MKKATMQEIADALNISRVTVWKVFNNYKGVSEALRTEVLEKAKEMGYTKYKQTAVSPPVPQAPAAEEAPMTVSVVVSRPESSNFWMNIIHQIAKELTKSDITLMYTYLPSRMPGSDYTLPISLTDGTTQGIIVLNVYDEDMTVLLNSLPFPKVFLDVVTSHPIEDLTGDLFLIEGKHNVCKMAEYLIHRGRTRIGFIGDTGYARTNYERYEGYLMALSRNNLKYNSKYCLTEQIKIESQAEGIKLFLEKMEQMPEAFVCASDHVASYLMQYLTEKGYRIPEDVAVTGFDGSTEYPGVADFLTTSQVNGKVLGKRLVNNLLFQINNEEPNFAVSYVYSDILWRNSTDI